MENILHPLAQFPTVSWVGEISSNEFHTVRERGEIHMTAGEIVRYPDVGT